MTEWLGIHNELHRLILLKRWIDWADRFSRRNGHGKASFRRLNRLRLRLDAWMPTWADRHPCGLFDGGVP